MGLVEQKIRQIITSLVMFNCLNALHGKLWGNFQFSNLIIASAEFQRLFLPAVMGIQSSDMALSCAARGWAL